jgi:crossover junction endodeoxyribonuclease RuvC
MAKVLGIDPGVSETGWAILEAADGAPPRLIDAGLIKTRPDTELPERLRLIHAGLSDVISRHQPESVAVEEMFFIKVAHTIRATLQARGVVLLAAAQAGKPVSEYNPRSVKLAITGSGAADKTQMQIVVQKTLGLAERLRPDDVADAAAIALCHLRSQRVRRLKVLDQFGGKKVPR